MALFLAHLVHPESVDERRDLAVEIDHGQYVLGLEPFDDTDRGVFRGLDTATAHRARAVDDEAQVHGAAFEHLFADAADIDQQATLLRLVRRDDVLVPACCYFNLPVVLNHVLISLLSRYRPSRCAITLATSCSAFLSLRASGRSTTMRASGLALIVSCLRRRLLGARLAITGESAFDSANTPLDRAQVVGRRTRALTDQAHRSCASRIPAPGARSTPLPIPAA